MFSHTALTEHKHAHKCDENFVKHLKHAAAAVAADGPLFEYKSKQAA